MPESWRKIESNCHLLSISISVSFRRSLGGWVAWKVCLVMKENGVWGEGESEMWMKVWRIKGK